jgi:CotH kinase protein/Secretion system C-terminal sorting domain
MKKVFLLIFFHLILFTHPGISQVINHWETAVFSYDIWRYQVGTSEPDQNWRTLLFDDSDWPRGPGGFGFGDNDDNTEISPCRSIFIRIKFNITDTSLIKSAILNIDYDDGFVAYLNDIEIARAGVQGIHPSHDELAEDHEAVMYKGGSPESFLIRKKKLIEILLPGENILAVQVHNSSATSSDLSSNVWLSFGITGTSSLFRQVPGWFMPVPEFTSSRLPVVVINTPSGVSIKNEPKTTAEMKIIYHGNDLPNNIDDPGNIYSGKVGIEIRGRYSATLPQKPYGFETRDDAGNNLNVPILGMPEENDWTLTANYNDKAFLRNYLAFELFREMGHYAPRMAYCEVVVNDQYNGIYLIGEKIKRDKNRVNIAKLNPDENTGDDLTGGYIFANDYYTSTDSWLSNYRPLNKPEGNVYFVYYDPKPDELTTVQKEYLKDYVDSFEKILYSSGYTYRSSGYRAYLDVNSFVDYFLLGELTRNVDAYKKSRFYYKDKDSNGGKIHSGPPWDYDWAWKDITENCINFNQTDGSGWAYRINDCSASPVPPSWEVRLVQDKTFANQIYNRYVLLRKTILSETSLYHIIDSVANLLNEAQKRHYQKWKILGINVGTPEYGVQPDTYEGEIEKFKSWINRRLRWLDANMLGEEPSENSEHHAIFRVFPNPAENTLHVESDEIINGVSVYTLLGNPALERYDFGDYTTVVNISPLKSGLYIVRIYFKSGEIVTQRFVKK